VGSPPLSDPAMSFSFLFKRLLVSHSYCAGPTSSDLRSVYKFALELSIISFDCV
jgi:hypothetical protein